MKKRRRSVHVGDYVFFVVFCAALVNRLPLQLEQQIMFFFTFSE
jgi:hypothetical protein